MVSSRLWVVVPVALLGVVAAIPSTAYHTNYTPVHSTQYRSGYTAYPQHYLPVSIVDDVVTVISEEERAYKRYDEYHRHFPGNATFSRVALAKKDNANYLRDILKRYNVVAPPTKHPSTPAVYEEYDACHLATRNENRVSEIYGDILLKKLRNYQDIHDAVKKLAHAAEHDYETQFADCAKYTKHTAQPVYHHDPYVHTPTSATHTYTTRRYVPRNYTYRRYQPRTYTHTYAPRSYPVYTRARTTPRYRSAQYYPRTYSQYTTRVPRSYTTYPTHTYSNYRYRTPSMYQYNYPSVRYY